MLVLRPKAAAAKASAGYSCHPAQTQLWVQLLSFPHRVYQKKQPPPSTIIHNTTTTNIPLLGGARGLPKKQTTPKLRALCAKLSALCGGAIEKPHVTPHNTTTCSHSVGICSAYNTASNRPLRDDISVRCYFVCCFFAAVWRLPCSHGVVGDAAKKPAPRTTSCKLL